MEYYWGYAAASTPLPKNVYHQRGSRPTPARSNSTNVGPTTRRSRIPGHRRTTSTDSARNHPSHDIALHLDLAPPPANPPPPALAAPPADGDGPRERMTASARLQSKQLPPTPRLETHDASARYSTGLTRTSSVSGSALSPGAWSGSSVQASPASPGPASPASHKIAFALADRRPAYHNATMPPDAGVLPRSAGFPLGRTASVSSTSGIPGSTRTMPSTEPPPAADGGPPSPPHQQQTRPFVVRNGRTYLADASLPYPLPVDLNELNRQSIRTMLLLQLFRGPICSPAFANKPPSRVLEVGCGTGFWSNMCHRYYSRHGHPSISFTGLDVARIGGAASSGSGSGSVTPPVSDPRPDKDMRWRLVQHDMRQMPWPLADDEFDLIMVKDLSLATTTGLQQDLMDEYLRILRPGGTLEIWESDHTLRMLRPHLPEHNHNCAADDEEEHDAAASLGAYLMTANTPLSAPLNNFLVEYNGWVAKALEQRSLSPVPCTLIGPMLVQEADMLTAVGSRRLAVPLSEIKWEREGVGGVITKDGKSYIETKAKPRDAEPGRKTLTAGQIALRRTALLTVVQSIQNLEPVLRDVSGKSQDEWDTWAGKMMNDLVKENGTFWGECLEVGAWWARKRKG